jgi:hypothetical protein
MAFTISGEAPASARALAISASRYACVAAASLGLTSACAGVAERPRAITIAHHKRRDPIRPRKSGRLSTAAASAGAPERPVLRAS